MILGDACVSRAEQAPLPWSGQPGLDHRAGHFRPSDMADRIPQPPVLQWSRYFYLGRRLLEWPMP